MLSSDDDRIGEGSKSDRKKVLKKKKAKKLVLSDDSGDEEDEQKTDKMSVKSDEKEGSIKDAEENDDGKVVMYDSEENEVTMEEYKKKFKGFKNKKGK